MSLHLLGGAVVSDATGVSCTRIGWLDELMSRVESGQLAAQLAERQGGALAMSPGRDQDVAHPQPVLKNKITQTPVVSLVHAAAQCLATCASLASREVQTDAEGLLERFRAASESCSTAVQATPSSMDAATMAVAPERLHAHVQATVAASTVSTDCEGLQTPTETDTRAVQTDIGRAEPLVEAAVQTDPVQAPKPGGLRQQQLSKEAAENQLAKAREQLSLERETSAALEGRLSKAARLAAEVQRQNAALQEKVAAESAKAAALAERPVTVDSSAQAVPEALCAEVQTDRLTFYSHSWFRRSADDPFLSSGPEIKFIDSSSQTAGDVSMADQSMQTTAMEMAHACVGGDDELPSLPDDASRWRTQYEDGMRALAESWRSRFEASEGERHRLQQRLGSTEEEAD
eukprot:TRINITY_DN69308_c0_g1_i1.p1 TRINITY_DN69308_c0_g1~~TRINITY_DN69308_c0_g1_i1.p1  ORF type:complete len:403 (-),score=92.98 TRINITY_DN69308_c0_g1_i1:542-1750(-)